MRLSSLAVRPGERDSPAWLRVHVELPERPTLRFGKQFRQRPCSSLTLILKVVVEQHVRRRDLARERLHIAGDVPQLGVAVVVVETL